MTDNMNSYHYQRRFFYLESVFFLAIGIVFALTLIPTIAAVINSGIEISSALRITFLIDSTLLFTLALGYVIKKEMKSVEFFISDESITKKSLYRIKTIEFNNIEKISYFRIPFITEGFLLKDKKGYLALSLQIVNAGKLIEEIRLGLLKYNKENLLDDPKYQLFKSNSLLKDCVSSYRDWLFTSLLKGTALFTIWNMILAYFIWNQSLLTGLNWILSTILFPYGIQISADVMINAKIKKNLSSHDENCLIDTNSLYGKLILMGVAVYLLTGIIYSRVNL